MVLVDNLDYTYSRSGKRAVKGISFGIERGEIFGFLGPSGAGKTTTQSLLIGLLRGYKGSVEIMGKERNRWGNDFFNEVGVAFESPNLYLKLTAKENLELIAGYYKNQAHSPEALLDMVGLLPDMDRQVGQFSKGMKMRLNFVRSLIHDPKIIFFDEPTSGLDPVNAKVIKDTILNLKDRGRTVFLTTHNMTVAEQLCDRVAFMVDGDIPVTGNPDELMIEYGKEKVAVTDTYGYDHEFDMRSLKSNEEFMALLNQDAIRTIHSKEATLEEVFIQLTGRSLL